MVSHASDEWVADIESMTCVNTKNNIIVEFEKTENIFEGKIKNIPLELVKKWTSEKQCEKNIKNAVKEAEEIFLREYSKNN